MQRIKFCVETLLLFGILISSARAIDLNAGDYDSSPAGTTIGELYLQDDRYNGLYNNSSKLPGQNNSHIDIGIGILQHYTDIDGVLTCPQILLPFARTSESFEGSAPATSQGFGNMILAMPVWLVNAQQTYLTITPFLYLPNTRSPADNRYTGILQAAFSTHLAPKIAWDIAADTTAYSNNTDAVGGTLSQKMGYELQTNARYFLSPLADLRAGIAYTDAGATKQDGITTGAYTESKFWLGTGLWASTKTQVILTYGEDIAVKNGFKDTNQVNMKLVQVF